MLASRVLDARVVVGVLLACACHLSTAPPPGLATYAIGARGGRMLSPDGVLLVGVAPASGAPETLAVSVVDPKSIAGAFAGLHVVAAYELGPSGSSFTPGVTVEFDLTRLGTIARDEEFLMWHSDGAGFQLVGEQAIVEGPQGVWVARGDVPHFSTVVLTRGPELSLSFTSDDFRLVGENVTSSGRLTATAASTAQAAILVMRAVSSGALAQVDQGRDFGAITGDEQAIDRRYDEVACARAGLGVFDLHAEFTVYTRIANGKRTAPATVRRDKTTAVLCHLPGGTHTVGGAGTPTPAQSLTISPVTVEARVGETFILEVQLAGRTGRHGLLLKEVLPDALSPPRSADPALVGAATNVLMGPQGVGFDLSGTGGVRVAYDCVKPGETGIVVTTLEPTLIVTARVTCRARNEERD